MLKLGKCAWAALAVLAATVNAEASSQDVGSVEKVARNVYGTPPQASRAPQHPGDTVAFQELLETLTDSAALVRFIDGSQLTIGAQSKVLVDQFVFDPGSGAGHALISIGSGALRFATGSMPKGKTVIDTPTATLTLRGTVVRVGVKPNGDTELIVDAGNVDSHNKQLNTDQNVPAGGTISISSTGFASGNDTVGDAFVDNGFADAGNGSSDVEQRRNAGSNAHSSAGSGSSGSGGGSSGGGTGGGSSGGSGGANGGGSGGSPTGGGTRGN
jgi:hypothetical protein